MKKLALLVLFLWGLAVKAFAANIGPVLPVSTKTGNQQNPTVVALPDHGFWFVAWEDWQNPLDADIYGAFVRMEEANATDKDACLAQGYVWNNGRCYEKAELCVEPFLITTADNETGLAGNQITPAAAYSPDNGTILVVWKDDGSWDPDHAWLHLAYRFLTVPDNCTETPELKDIGWVPYDPVFDCQECQGTCSCRRDYTYEEICARSGYFFANGTCYSELLDVANDTDCHNNGGFWIEGLCYAGPQSEIVLCLEQGFEWDDNNNACFDTQEISFIRSDRCQEENFLTIGEIDYPGYPDCNAGTICGEDNNPASPGLCGNLGEGWFSTNKDNNLGPYFVGWEGLTLREKPTVVYNSWDRAFWLGWVEVRNQRNRLRFLAPCLISEWTTGEGIFPGYAECFFNGTGCAWEEVDILRNRSGWGEHTARLFAVSSTDTGYQASYEYFTGIDQVSLAPDLRNGGVYFSFSGRRHEGTIKVNCDEQKDSFTEQETPEGHAVYGILERQMRQTGIHATELSTSTPAYHPALEYDPVTGRFLVVWEDSRDTGPNTPKIYGQLIEGVSGAPYQANFCLSPEVQKEAEIKQSAPAVEWDPVNQRFFVAWQDNRAGSVSVENMDIFGQKVDPDGSLRGGNLLVSATENGEPTAGNQLAPAVAYDPGKGIYLAVWKDARNYEQTGSDIYAQAFGVDQPQLALLDGDSNLLYRWMLDFGTLNAGDRASLNFYLRNSGDAALRLCELSPLEAPFAYTMVPQTLIDGDFTSCLQLQPGMQVEIMVEFAPDSEGSFSATIRITSDAGEHTLLLQGGARPVISTDQANFDFGEVVTGTESRLRFTLTNHLDQDVTVTGISGPAAPFRLEGLGSGDVIPAGGSLTASVVFAPTEAGSFSDQITLSFSKGNQIELNLTGQGLQILTLSQTSFVFGGWVGLSQNATLELENLSGQDITLTVSGPAAPFRLEGLGSGDVIPAGGSLTASVVFAPTEAGSFSDQITLSFSYNGTEKEVFVSLEGQASFPLEAAPESLNFGEIPITTEKSLLLEIRNLTPDHDLTLENLEIPAPFRLEGLGSGDVIPAGGSLTASVVFAPTEAGSFSDQITLSFSYENGEQVSFSVPLAGSGLEPLGASPAGLNFGEVAPGESRSLILYLQNQSQETVFLDGLDLPAPPFHFWNEFRPTPLLPGETLKLKVLFAPDEPGAYEDRLIVRYHFQGFALTKEIPLTGACSSEEVYLYSSLPHGALLKEGQVPVWLLSVRGVSEPPEVEAPSWLEATELHATKDPYVYLFSFRPGSPGSYQGEVALGGAVDLVLPVSLSFYDLPYQWYDLCPSGLPEVSLALNGQKGLFISTEEGVSSLVLRVGISWSCAPAGLRDGQATLTVRHVSPTGVEDRYFYQVETGAFAETERRYALSPPVFIDFPINLFVALAPVLPADPSGLWLFELRLELGGETFYAQAAAVVDRPPDKPQGR